MRLSDLQFSLSWNGGLEERDYGLEAGWEREERGLESSVKQKWAIKIDKKWKKKKRLPFHPISYLPNDYYSRHFVTQLIQPYLIQGSY